MGSGASHQDLLRSGELLQERREGLEIGVRLAVVPRLRQVVDHVHILGEVGVMVAQDVDEDLRTRAEGRRPGCGSVMAACGGGGRQTRVDPSPRATDRKRHLNVRT